MPADADMLVLFFPVHAFNAPKPIDEWIASAANGEDRPAAVISVSGGGEISPNTACRVEVIKKLKGKGYDVFYENMLIMPSNVMIRYDDVLSAMVLRTTAQKSDRAVSDILAGNRMRLKPHLVDRFLSKLGSLEKAYGNIFGKRLKADNNCTGCAWCANHCPRGNISMRENKPDFGSECVVCLRCVYGCPQNAIVPGSGKWVVLKDGYDLKTIENLAFQLTEFPPPSQTAKGLMLKGVRKYIEE